MIVDIVDKYCTNDNNPIKNLRLKQHNRTERLLVEYCTVYLNLIKSTFTVHRCHQAQVFLLGYCHLYSIYQQYLQSYFMSFCCILSTLCRQVVFHIVPHFSHGRTVNVDFIRFKYVVLAKYLHMSIFEFYLLIKQHSLILCKNLLWLLF